MNKYAKILALVLAVVLMAVGLTACQGGNKLTVATNAEFAPFEYLDENNEIIGLDADLIAKVAEKMGMEVVWQNMEFEAVLGAVQSGTAKIGLSGLTINEERKKSVDFSEPYYVAHQMVIAPVASTEYDKTTKAEVDAALVGKKIGVCSGFTGMDYVQGNADLNYPGIQDAEVKIYDNITLAIQDIKNGQIDVVVMDDVVAKKAAAQAENASAVKVIDVALTDEEYGIAIKKGDTETKEKIDAAIKELKAEGYLDQLAQTWIE